MKTKMRTLIGLVALGMITLTSNVAAAGDKVTNNKAIAETKESLVLKNWIQENNLYSERNETKADAKKAEQAREVETSIANEDFVKAAESYTASTSDKEIEKYAEKQIALGEERKSK